MKAFVSSDPVNAPEKGFWEIKTPSLRNFPQQFRTFEVYLNSDYSISIVATDVDQAVLPMFLGVTKKVPQYDFIISTDIVTVPGKDIMPTCEEIKKVRGGS